jgi:hypothetical protein
MPAPDPPFEQADCHRVSTPLHGDFFAEASSYLRAERQRAADTDISIGGCFA